MSYFHKELRVCDNSLEKCSINHLYCLCTICSGSDQPPKGTNHGYTVLIKLCDKVISGLSREPKALAHTLLGKGLLSQEKVDEINQIPATDKQNARKIYDVMLECVQHFPHRYTDFIFALKENALLYNDLLTALGETCHEAG